LEAKFRDCVAFAAKPIPESAVEQFIAAIRNLDQIEDMGEVMRLIA
jgi:hypothetical protein